LVLAAAGASVPAVFVGGVVAATGFGVTQAVRGVSSMFSSVTQAATRCQCSLEEKAERRCSRLSACGRVPGLGFVPKSPPAEKGDRSPMQVPSRPTWSADQASMVRLISAEVFGAPLPPALAASRPALVVACVINAWHESRLNPQAHNGTLLNGPDSERLALRPPLRRGLPLRRWPGQRLSELLLHRELEITRQPAPIIQ